MKTYKIWWKEYSLFFRNISSTRIRATSKRKAERLFLNDNPFCQILGTERIR